MRFLALSVVFGASFAATQNQVLPKLDKPLPVDMNVKSIEWHPKGKSLLYTRTEGAGRAIGAYMIGQEQGKVLVHLGKDDRYEIEWFGGKPNAIVMVYHPFIENGEKKLRIAANLVDLEHQTSQVILDRPFDAKDNAQISVDTSPSLLHAIFHVVSAKGQNYFVLKTGSFDVIPSPDLDKAGGQGIMGPNWSQDGTAIFANSAGAAPAIRLTNAQEVVISSGAVTGQQLEVAAKDISFTVSLSAEGLNAEGGFLRMRFSPPPPPVGATVLELMPQNATIRQVRFKGPWNELTPNVSAITSQNIPVLLTFGRSKSQANSVWLTPPKEKAETGVLVTPNATQAWIAPMNTSVAYLTDGVLFLRVITP